MKSIKRNYFISIFKEALMYGDLLKIFFLKDFKSNFKQTVLGPIWFLIQPIFSTLIFSILFGKVAGLSTDQIPKPLYYFSGIILFNSSVIRSFETIPIRVLLFDIATSKE